MASGPKRSGRKRPFMTITAKAAGPGGPKRSGRERPFMTITAKAAGHGGPDGEIADMELLSRLRLLRRLLNRARAGQDHAQARLLAIINRLEPGSSSAALFEASAISGSALASFWQRAAWSSLMSAVSPLKDLLAAPSSILAKLSAAALTRGWNLGPGLNSSEGSSSPTWLR